MILSYPNRKRFKENLSSLTKRLAFIDEIDMKIAAQILIHFTDF